MDALFGPAAESNYMKTMDRLSSELRSGTVWAWLLKGERRKAHGGRKYWNKSFFWVAKMQNGDGETDRAGHLRASEAVAAPVTANQSTCKWGFNAH